MARLFLSYASPRRALVRTVAEKLQAHGYRYFVDKPIPGGAAWESAIHKEIRASDALILCATTEAVASQWVAAEVAIARYQGLLPGRHACRHLRLRRNRPIWRSHTLAQLIELARQRATRTLTEAERLEYGLPQPTSSEESPGTWPAIRQNQR